MTNTATAERMACGRAALPPIRQIANQRWALIITIGFGVALIIVGGILGYNYHTIKKKNITLVTNVKGRQEVGHIDLLSKFAYIDSVI